MRDEKIPIISFVANTGGLLGLCMGFSLVSVFEIMFHCGGAIKKEVLRRRKLEQSSCERQEHPDNSINDVDVSNIISEDTNSSKRKETDELEGETNTYKDNDSNTMIDHTNLNKRKQTDE